MVRPRRIPIAGTALAVLLSVAPAPLRAGQTFRSGIDLRVIDVVVTDEDGRPVTGLGPGDFEVIEDGQPRPVRFVTPVSIPETPPSVDPEPVLPPDVWTNASVDSRRIFAIVIDDLSTQASDTAKARHVVNRFIDRVPQGDLVAVVFTGQQTGAQEFTSDKARLRRSLENYVGRNPIADLDMTMGDSPGSMRMMQNARLGGERRQGYQAALETLTNVAEWLSGVQDQRKAILFVTAGLPPQMAQAFLGGLEDPSNFRGGPGAEAKFAGLVAAAAEANVSLYPLDYRGLATPLNRKVLTVNVPGGLSPLAVMADETGGVAAIHTNDVDSLFDTMIRDSSEYYLIGYEPAVAVDEDDGDDDEDEDDEEPRTHRIEVRALREGVTVRSRASYITGPEPSSDDRERAAAHLLSSPLPGGALGVRLQAAAFPRDDDEARVVVVLDVAGDSLAVEQDEDVQTVALSYQIAATNVYGEVEASDAHTVTLRLSDDRLQEIAESRLRVIAHLDLDSGSYRLRAGVVNGDSHGVVSGDVDVPEYDEREISVSGVLLSSTESAKVPVRRDDYEPFEGRLPAAPTTQRSFDANEEVDAYMEIYVEQEGDDNDPQRPLVTAALRAASGHAISEVPVTVGTRQKGLGGSRVYPVNATLPMAGLAAGNYVLDLSISLGEADPLRTSVAFSVR